MCFQFRFKCRYSDVEVVSDGARKGIPDTCAMHAKLRRANIVRDRGRLRRLRLLNLSVRGGCEDEGVHEGNWVY